MQKIFFLLCLTCIATQTLFANDSTLVKIFFNMNDYKLLKTEQVILDEIMPNDSSIVLKKISIYGYCDSLEKENGKHNLSFQRANEVKKYLIRKGIAASLITTVEGRGKKINEPKNQTKQVLIWIEYEALSEEEPIIIKSSKKKLNSDE